MDPQRSASALQPAPPERDLHPDVGRSGAAPGFILRRLGIVQGLELVWCALAIGLDWVRGALRDVWAPRARRAARRRAWRRRAATRLVATLGRLKGPFAKVGQFAALRYDVLPAELREPLAALQSRVPPLDAGRIRAIVERELAAPLEARFARFEPRPLGAASIAQAHRAQLPSGEAVVVKVQYPWLEPALRADLAWLRGLLAVATRLRSGVNRGRLFEEFASGLREELDFLREAAVAEEVARNLAADDRIVVPQVIHSHTTRRVLTMRHHDAVAVDDREGLRRLGVDAREVVEILARAYAKQIFVDGLFHADPHPGNLFVIDEPSARERPRLLFVDFGLSKRLRPELRRELRLGIYALLSGDAEAFLAGMERMGMIAPGARPQVERAVRAMLARLRGEGSGPLALSGTRVLALKDEAKGLLEQTPGLQLPNDLLLYAKTLSYLFGLGAAIAPGADLMKVAVPYLLRFLAEPEARPASGAGALARGAEAPGSG